MNNDNFALLEITYYETAIEKIVCNGTFPSFEDANEFLGKVQEQNKKEKYKPVSYEIVPIIHREFWL